MHSIDDSPEYYRKREAEERAAAAEAADEATRQIHLTLADEYRSRAEDAEQAT